MFVVMSANGCLLRDRVQFQLADENIKSQIINSQNTIRDLKVVAAENVPRAIVAVAGFFCAVHLKCSIPKPPPKSFYETVY